MVGVNVPIPVPMAFFSFGGWRASLFGDQNVHGMDGVRFYTRQQDAHVALAGRRQRRPGLSHADAGLKPATDAPTGRSAARRAAACAADSAGFRGR